MIEILKHRIVDECYNYILRVILAACNIMTVYRHVTLKFMYLEL